MGRRIEWNSEHSAEDQEMEFRMQFVKWPFERKWNYLMQLFKMGRSEPNVICSRKIEW